MELWIRSQDKEELLKIDNVRIKNEYEQKKVNDNYGRTCAYINGAYKCSYIYSDSTWLGEYKSKERALEVLDEIQDMIINNGIKNEVYDEISGCYYATKKNIYEMPME